MHVQQTAYIVGHLPLGLKRLISFTTKQDVS